MGKLLSNTGNAIEYRRTIKVRGRKIVMKSYYTAMCCFWGGIITFGKAHIYDRGDKMNDKRYFNQSKEKLNRMEGRRIKKSIIRSRRIGIAIKTGYSGNLLSTQYAKLLYPFFPPITHSYKN